MSNIQTNEITYGLLRINLSTPILVPTNRPWEGIKLDGLLGFLWALDNGLRKNPGENLPENVKFPELPLIQIEPRVYGASTMFLPAPDDEALCGNHVQSFPEIINKTANWDKSFQMQIRKGLANFKPSKGSGAFRASMEHYWIISTPCVEFYWATDNFPALRSYFERIPTDLFGLGAKARAGYGSIRSIDIEDRDKDNCFYFEFDGYPTRPLPVNGRFKGLFPDSCIALSSCRPPYFNACNRELCYTPPASQYLPQNLTEICNNEDFSANLDLSSKKYQKIFERSQNDKEGGKKP